MTQGELQHRGAAGRDAEDGGTLDPQMVQQQRIGVRLVGRRRLRRQRGAEVSKARGADDPVSLAQHVRPPAVGAVGMAAEHAVAVQDRQPRPAFGVLDRSEAGLEPRRRDRSDSAPGPLHVLSILADHFDHLQSCPTGRLRHAFPGRECTTTEAASASSDLRAPSAKRSMSGQSSRSATAVMLNWPAYDSAPAPIDTLAMMGTTGNTSSRGAPAKYSRTGGPGTLAA